MAEELTWQLASLWNKGYDELAVRRADKVPTARDYLWATDLGKAYVDVYLEMIGTKPTNPMSNRAFRKMEAGSMIEETVIKKILERLGVLKVSQEHVEFQYDGQLRVTGRLDYMAGGKIDVERAKEVLETGYDYLSGNIKKVFEYIVEGMAQEYPDGIETVIMDLKTASLNMFNYYERTGSAGRNHKLQVFHYLKSKGMFVGHIVYLCRDDMRMAEYGVFNPSVIEDEYKEFIDKMTYYYNEKVMPEVEDTILWDDKIGKFTINSNVMYSKYLSMLYGYGDQEEYRKKIVPQTTRMNTALKRLMAKQKMTKQNLESLELIGKMGWYVDDLMNSITSLNDEEEDESQELIS